MRRDCEAGLSCGREQARGSGQWVEALDRLLLAQAENKTKQKIELKLLSAGRVCGKVMSSLSLWLFRRLISPMVIRTFVIGREMAPSSLEMPQAWV